MKRLLPSRHLYRQSKPSLQKKAGLLPLSTSYYTTTLNKNIQSQPPHKPPGIQYFQKRSFLSSFIPSPPNPSNGNNNGNNARTLTASRTLLYPPSPLFKTISSVESYAEFLPFLNASTVTARDTETGYPTSAYLTVGYGPLSETFTSKVNCDEANWIVEATSGEKFLNSDSSPSSSNSAKKDTLPSGLSALAGFAGFPAADEGIFEYLSTKWELVPESASDSGLSSNVGRGRARTTVNLEIRFEFKNALYAKMMGAVEGQMAGVMIEAFERRVREVHGV